MGDDGNSGDQKGKEGWDSGERALGDVFGKRCDYLQKPFEIS